MDDFSIFGLSFDECLANLSTVLKKCEEVSFVLSWENNHFMVRKGLYWVIEYLRRELRLIKLRLI